MYAPTPSSPLAFEAGTGEEVIWNLAREVAALVAELDIFFTKEAGSAAEDGVLWAGLLVSGVHGVDGVFGFLLCWWHVEVRALFLLREGCFDKETQVAE